MGKAPSDIGRLFRRRASAIDPIENFVSEALAIAISHDDGPIRAALGKVFWHTEQPKALTDVVRITAARTQVFLPATNSLGHGYLDLALVTQRSDGSTGEAWIEAKVEASEHGEQLDLYVNHAHLRDPSPIIIALSRHRLRDRAGASPGREIGWLSWLRLVESAEETKPRDRSWDDFITFLREEWIVAPPLPSGSPKPDDYAPVLVGVNEILKRRWRGGPLHWSSDSRLLESVHAAYKETNRIVTTGGPLTYGLVPAGDEWAWSLTFGSKNAQRVQMEETEIVLAADAGQLPARWVRGQNPRAVLEVKTSLAEAPTYEAAIDWFDAALAELADGGIIQYFIAQLQQKQSRRADPPV